LLCGGVAEMRKPANLRMLNMLMKRQSAHTAHLEANKVKRVVDGH
jgi:hypothetical protein